ncbi:MAG: hypothetical protein KatS3mg097_633 [Candidatus Parcubacteria bacterium]|nr:MAG: hypothetical protein KatS3mg097_633 [Candidatus Parcubacteria bacterium]
MVKLIQKENQNYYECEECHYAYGTEELAQKCENWCKTTRSCNLEIIKYGKKFEIDPETAIKNEKTIGSTIISGLLGVFVGGFLVFIFSKFNYINGNLMANKVNVENIIQAIVAQVLPKEGFQTRLAFGNSVQKMIDCKVIDIEKLKKLYNGNIPEYIQKAIDGNNEPIVINNETANYLLTLFWPLGLSNKTEFNENIPFSKKDLPYLASTGGWWLGEKNNGVEYFNKCEIIKLTPEQESIVYEVAQNTYRPCCNNSTFAQDCNHGSALLGALELAASQGYSKDELYKLALQLNSFWFPDNYVKIALYKKLVENQDWQNINPKEIMSIKYSSISGYLQNVEKKLAQLNLPGIQTQGAGCGLQNE